ncbi:hypothetical protein LY78DRAFT_693078 [Colletotrichum sublineola]|nr:hypothetical protein LY78DRAFT_693078 [Colletotrichum sublineola]
MRFFQAAFFIFGLSSAVCALATPAGLHAADELAPLDVDSFDAEALDIEARNVEEEADELAPLDIEARYVEEEADEFAPLDMEARNIEEEADEFAPLDAEAVDVDALDIEGPIDVTRSIKASNIAARKVEEEAEELQALHEAMQESQRVLLNGQPMLQQELRAYYEYVR